MQRLTFTISEKTFLSFFVVHSLIQTVNYSILNAKIWDSSLRITDLFGHSLPQQNPDSFQSAFFLVFFENLVQFIVLSIFLLVLKVFYDKYLFQKIKKQILILIFMMLIYLIILISTIQLSNILWLYASHPEIPLGLNLDFWVFTKLAFFDLISGREGIILLSSHLSSVFFILSYLIILNLNSNDDFIILSNKLLQNLINKNDSDKGRKTLSDFSPSEDAKKTNNIFVVNKFEKEYIISASEIFALESSGNYVNLDNGVEIFPIKTTLEKILLDLPENFKRIHRSTIIDFNKIKSVKSDSVKKKLIVKLNNNKEYAVARSYQISFKTLYKNKT